MKRFLAVVLLLVASLARAADACIPTEAERARWTMDWVFVFEACKTDHKECPRAGAIDGARAIAEPMYIRDAPLIDAWGHTFPGASRGADGTPDPFDDDEVAGKRSRWPVLHWEFK